MPAPQLLRKTLMFLVLCSAYTGVVFAASSDSTALDEKIARVEQCSTSGFDLGNLTVTDMDSAHRPLSQSGIMGYIDQRCTKTLHIKQ
jgi:hypothetical protein